VVISEEIYVMLLTHDKFMQFSPNPICDTSVTEVLTCLSCESREEVDEITRRAVEAGGATFREPIDMGPMYGQSFRDLDGHVWELMYMDMSAIGQQT
jgi:predicted lactoylglutathione lyase